MKNLISVSSTMRTRFTDYKSYADATINDIFTTEELKNVNHFKASYLQTAYKEMGKGISTILASRNRGFISWAM